MYLFGGVREDGLPLNDLHVFDFGQWMFRCSPFSESRSDISSTLTTAERHTWKEILSPPGVAPRARHSHVAIISRDLLTHRDQLIIHGGVDERGKTLSDTHALDLGAFKSLGMKGPSSCSLC
jgi:hypothetical protein